MHHPAPTAIRQKNSGDFGSEQDRDSGGLTITPAFHMPDGQQQQQQQLVTLKLPLLKLLDPEDSSPELGADAADDAAGRAVGSVAEAAGNSSSNRNSHVAAGGAGEMMRWFSPANKYQNHQHHEHQDQHDQHVKPDARGRPRGGGGGGVRGGRSDRGARVNRARSSSYGGKGSAPQEARETRQVGGGALFFYSPRNMRPYR